MANRKKYASPKSFAEAIEFYFGSISAKTAATQKKWVKDKGKWVEREEPMTDLNGNAMTRVVYMTPPTVGGLCLYLGISRQTFSEYGRRRGYAEAVENARARILAYLEEKISDPDVRNVKGVAQAMEMLIAAITEEGRQSPPLSTAERQTLLREAVAAGFIGEEGDAE